MCALLAAQLLDAQNSMRQDTAIIRNTLPVNTASTQLLNSIAENKPAGEVAKNYAVLARSLSAGGDYARAETYLKKAVELESTVKGQKNLAGYYRELAKAQEAQRKYVQASSSYSQASQLAADTLNKRLNRNDAQRMQVKSSPESELKLLNSNAALLSNTGNNREKADNFTQIANTNLTLNNNTQALENYREALLAIDSTQASNTVAIKSNMVDLLVASSNLPEAISLQKEIVHEAPTAQIQVGQLINLSELYIKLDSIHAAQRLLEDAYTLAITNASVKEARQCVLALAAFYSAQGQPEKANDLEQNFIRKLDTLLGKDSSLIDRRLFLLNEARIAELQQQQTLKDELLHRRNRSNYILIGSVLLLLTLLGILVKGWLSIRRRNKLIALQSLRREMNPHFIFNSLNSVNQFIATSNEREANKYLTSYSHLMRSIMENSNKDYIPLSTEIDLLRKYLELEKMRFPDKFNWSIEIDPAINPEAEQIPNMLLQPGLENAIWHGLRYKQAQGLLTLRFRKEGTLLLAVIDDNGIGLEESQRLKTSNQKQYESLGLKNIRERIRLLNNLYKSTIRFDVAAKTGSESGTIVTLQW
jgi:two-component system, sensor histidine kinase YesM